MVNRSNDAMDLITSQSQGISSELASIDLRHAAINPHNWYAVARSSDLNEHPIAINLWHQPIVLYRNRKGQVQALENRCPHRQVNLSDGHVSGDEIICAYHGWRFDSTGACSYIPYLEAHQKLPKSRIRSYLAQEKHGFIWVYPGNSSHSGENSTAPLSIPEWDDLNHIATVSLIDVKCHFSFLIENLMDMYHGHLHDDLQAWTDPVLRTLEQGENRVDAHYDAQSYYRIDKIWSVLQLFIPSMRQLHSESLDVSYVYPNWIARLGNEFKIYCLFCPISETHTRAYLIHFTSLEAFHRLHKLPKWFRAWIKNSLFGAAQKMLDGLVEQDVLMLEQEQQAYSEHPKRKGLELNRAIISVQRLIRQQATAGGSEI